MSFEDLKLKPVYNSDDDSILDDFYIPVLKEAVQYDRAVGYFSVGLLSYALQGLRGLIQNKGRFRLLIGDLLEEEEYEAVKHGIKIKEISERLGRQLHSIFESTTNELLLHRLKLLSWLIATDSLEIKFALRKSGIFHQKIGILKDKYGNKVVFQGSANETIKAFDPVFNSESISVYPSWKKDIYGSYGESYENQFNKLWNGEYKNTITLSMPSEHYEKIRRLAKNKTVPHEIESDIYRSIVSQTGINLSPQLPRVLGGEKYELQKHQLEALENWRANDLRGIFALATGSGKTITAIHGVVSIFNSSKVKKVAMIVAVPYQVLADQWVDVLKLYNIKAITCYKSKAEWKNELEQSISNFNLVDEFGFFAVVVVNATLVKEDFQTAIRRLNMQQTIFIGDECHHHANIAKLLPEAKCRIGLSATPWSSNEIDKREKLIKFYGKVVAKFSIDDALSKGVLTPYTYNLHKIYLDTEESVNYESYSKEIGRLYAIKNSGGTINENTLDALLMKRARLIGSASDKFTKLQALTNSKPTDHSLFYCGDGSVETDEFGVDLRDVERTAIILHEGGWKTSRFTAEETARQRESILYNFKNSIINGIVAIRVLDEGFDIPACKIAYLLASSRNKRQFVQRRGRILRRSPNKEKAVIHDFVVLPAENEKNDYFNSLVESELKRCAEFIRVASNRENVFLEASTIGKKYNLNFEEIFTAVEAEEVSFE